MKIENFADVIVCAEKTGLSLADIMQAYDYKCIEENIPTLVAYIIKNDISKNTLRGVCESDSVYFEVILKCAFEKQDRDVLERIAKGYEGGTEGVKSRAYTALYDLYEVLMAKGREDGSLKGVCLAAQSSLDADQRRRAQEEMLRRAKEDPGFEKLNTIACWGIEWLDKEIMQEFLKRAAAQDSYELFMEVYEWQSARAGESNIDSNILSAINKWRKDMILRGVELKDARMINNAAGYFSYIDGSEVIRRMRDCSLTAWINGIFEEGLESQSLEVLFDLYSFSNSNFEKKEVQKVLTERCLAINDITQLTRNIEQLYSGTVREEAIRHLVSLVD